jgi:hypothetical protein
LHSLEHIWKIQKKELRKGLFFAFDARLWWMGVWQRLVFILCLEYFLNNKKDSERKGVCL